MASKLRSHSKHQKYQTFFLFSLTQYTKKYLYVVVILNGNYCLLPDDINIYFVFYSELILYQFIGKLNNLMQTCENHGAFIGKLMTFEAIKY